MFRFISISLVCLPFILSPLNAQEKGSGASYFEKGNLFIINSSHQDIMWMDRPYGCVCLVYGCIFPVGWVLRCLDLRMEYFCSSFKPVN